LCGIKSGKPFLSMERLFSELFNHSPRTELRGAYSSRARAQVNLVRFPKA
jgi:hypothetical protein